MTMKQLLTISTSRLSKIELFETDFEANGEQMFLIVTTDNNGCVLTRFGNRTQMLSIMGGYRYSVSPESRDRYLKFMKR